MGMAIVPLETRPVLVVDADAILTLTIASQSFQPVAKQRREVVQAVGVIEHFEFPPRHGFNRLETPDSYILKEPLRLVVFA
jgi:hypothetical protein